MCVTSRTAARNQGLECTDPIWTTGLGEAPRAPGEKDGIAASPVDDRDRHISDPARQERKEWIRGWTVEALERPHEPHGFLMHVIPDGHGVVAALSQSPQGVYEILHVDRLPESALLEVCRGRLRKRLANEQKTRASGSVGGSRRHPLRQARHSQLTTLHERVEEPHQTNARRGLDRRCGLRTEGVLRDVRTGFERGHGPATRDPVQAIPR